MRHSIRLFRGFTLIELMIVVAIVAILAAVALPAYNDQVRKAHRAEARSALQQATLLQEKWRADHASYGTYGTGVVDITGPTTSENGHWNIAVALNANPAIGYTVTATKGSGIGDSMCGGGMVITVDNTVNPATAKTPAGCW